MKKTYTKKQITEAIAYWKKQLDESEDMFSIEQNMPIASAKDLIWKIDIDDPVLVVEFNHRLNSFDGIDVADDDISKVKQICQADLDKYRVFAYYVKNSGVSAFNDAKLAEFKEAFIAICDDGHGTEQDYDDFVNKTFSLYDPEEWEETYFERFKTAFPTYADFRNAISKLTVNELIKCLKATDTPLQYIDIDQVKTTQSGDAYVIVFWRA